MTIKLYERYRTLINLILLLLVFISLSSCSPIFKNPIPPPSELKADNQILGTWIRTSKAGQYESKEQLSFFERSSGWIDVVWIYDIGSKGSADGINLLVFEGYSTSVNELQFLCLRLREKDFSWILQKDHGPSVKEVRPSHSVVFWIIVNYETSNNGELIVRRFSRQKVRELIKKGKLKGEVAKEDVFKGTVLENARFNGQRAEDVFKSFDNINVTSSSDELAHVIYREGLAAFIGQDENDMLPGDDILVFSRIGVTNERN